MIKRIQDIKSIGCFSDTHPAAIQFEDLTFIYGENCYGKSTLCDIFRSVAKNDPKIIQQRMSIPNSENISQYFEMNFVDNEEDKEQPIIFQNDQWKNSIPNPFLLLVYDSDFIHRNVFTGLSIERKNQENITQFVFGDSNVEIARGIAKTKSEIRKLTKQISNLEKDVFSGIDDVNAFIQLEVNSNESNLENEGVVLNRNLSLKTELLNNLDEAIARPSSQLVNKPRLLDDFIRSINAQLNSSIGEIHDKAEERIKNHIMNHTSNLPSTERWVHDGIEQISDDYCPFCGEIFAGESESLIKMYKEYFNELYEKYAEGISEAINNLLKELEQYEYGKLLTLLAENEISFSKYPELDENPEYSLILNNTNETSNQIKKLLKSWLKEYKNLLAQIQASFDKKRESIHKRMDDISIINATQKHDEFTKTLDKYNKCVSSIDKHIANFKDGLNESEVSKAINTLQADISSNKLRIRRLQLHDSCKTYNVTNAEKSKRVTDLERLEELLAKGQNVYLDQYFDKINRIFRDLGSGDFTISKKVSKLGDLPTVLLTASFKGVPITNDQLHKFFSESDRRALALAIFWAKIESLSKESASNTIIVLDDPVTSFDDGRIDRTIRLMEGKKSNVRQIIVLSHYPKFLKVFFDRAYSEESGIQIIKLIQNQNGSDFEQTDRLDFVESLHQKAFRRINEFINKVHKENIRSELRVFLESEIKSRFWMHLITEKQEHLQLNKLGCALKEDGIISETVHDKFDQLRKSLNPDHHIWTDATVEDKIGLAKDVFNFIYYELQSV